MESFVLHGHGLSPQSAVMAAQLDLREWLDRFRGDILHVAMDVTYMPKNDPEAIYVCTLLVIYRDHTS